MNGSKAVKTLAAEAPIEDQTSKEWAVQHAEVKAEGGGQANNQDSGRSRQEGDRVGGTGQQDDDIPDPQGGRRVGTGRVRGA